MINALLKVRNLGCQPLGEAAGDLAQEYARLRERIEKPNRTVRPDVRPVVRRRPGFGKGVQHTVGKLRRREHLVIGKIGYAGQNIGVAPAKRKARLIIHMASRKPSSNGQQASARAVIG